MASKSRANPENAKIREWANEHGIRVPIRGRISKDVRDAYAADVAARRRASRATVQTSVETPTDAVDLVTDLAAPPAETISMVSVDLDAVRVLTNGLDSLADSVKQAGAMTGLTATVQTLAVVGTVPGARQADDTPFSATFDGESWAVQIGQAAE